MEDYSILINTEELMFLFLKTSTHIVSFMESLLRAKCPILVKLVGRRREGRGGGGLSDPLQPAEAVRGFVYAHLCQLRSSLKAVFISTVLKDLHFSVRQSCG